MTGHLFFAIINAEKGIVTRCVRKWKITQRERGVFDGKNISDRELFLPADAFRRSWFFRRIWKSLRWKRSRQTTPIPLPLSIHLPEAEGELLVNRVDLQVFRNRRRTGEPPDRCERRSSVPMHCIVRQHKIMHRCFVGRWYLAWSCKSMRLYFCLFLHWNAACQSSPCLILHCAYTGVSGESNALFCTIGNGQNHAGGTLGTVPGKPYRKWG